MSKRYVRVRPPSRQFVSIHREIVGRTLFVHRGTGEFGMFMPGLQPSRTTWHTESTLPDLIEWAIPYQESGIVNGPRSAILARPQSTSVMSVNVVWSEKTRRWVDEKTGVEYDSDSLYPSTSELWAKVGELKRTKSEIDQSMTTLTKAWERIFSSTPKLGSLE